VQSGFMPTHTVIYSLAGVPEYQLGIHHRNTLKWSPMNRFLLVAGFENLKGEIDVWDIAEMKEIGKCISPHASFVEWAPDGRHFFTAIIEQTLRVSNEVSVRLFFIHRYSSTTGLCWIGSNAKRTS
jgi:translation initiation factor 2A